MILTAPSIWRPQSLIEWFTEGKVQRDPTSGKIKRKSANGKAVRNSATNSTCCCSPPVSPCSVCPTTPTTVTAVVSGITTCLCQFPSPNISTFQSLTGDPNGTFTLTQNAIVPCCYEYFYDPGVCQFVEYSADPTCTIVSATYPAHIYACYTTLGGGSIYLGVIIDRTNSSGRAFVTSENAGGGQSIADCFASSTCTNAITGCRSITNADLGYGGSVVLTGNP